MQIYIISSYKIKSMLCNLYNIMKTYANIYNIKVPSKNETTVPVRLQGNIVTLRPIQTYHIEGSLRETV